MQLNEPSKITDELYTRGTYKMNLKEILGNLTLIGIFTLIIIIFNKFVLKNLKILMIIFFFFLMNYIIIIIHERKYSKGNFPYKPYKSKNKLVKKILLGFLAGIHYSFYIGNYNHKKYNTQIWYPETLECFFGNISQLIILILYTIIAFNLLKINWIFSLIFMIIPIITNIISILKYKKVRK